MPRYIDADELLNDIEDAIDVENDGQDIKKSKFIILGLKIAKKYIKKARTIEAEPVNDWISVKDRLPEIGEHYRSKLVMCYTPDGEHEYLFDYYEVNGFGQGCFTAEKYFDISITHWRHLPEPPKGE